MGWHFSSNSRLTTHCTFLQDRTNEVEICNNFNSPAKCGYPFHHHKGLWKGINHKYIIKYLQSDNVVVITSSLLLNPFLPMVVSFKKKKNIPTSNLTYCTIWRRDCSKKWFWSLQKIYTPYCGICDWISAGHAPRWGHIVYAAYWRQEFMSCNLQPF